MTFSTIDYKKRKGCQQLTAFSIVNLKVKNILLSV